MNKMDDAPETSEAGNRSQRIKPRYSAHLKVELFTKGLEHHLIERTANISSGGLFVCTDISAGIDDKVHLRIIFSDKAAYFDVKAVVVWVCDGSKGHPKGLGVEFIDMNAAQQAIVDRHLVEYVNVRDR